MPRLKISQLVDKFDLEVLAGAAGLKKEIKISGLNRAGIELSGNFVYKTLERSVLLGQKEFDFLSTIPAAESRKRLEALIKHKPPVVILSKNFDKGPLVAPCNKYGVPLLRAREMGSSEIMGSIGNYLTEELLQYKTLHGTLMELYGEGVMIQGESGIGKSEIAMELIRKGHMFIADDAVSVARVSGRLLGKANPVTRNFIEVRGLGILNVPRMFGIEKVRDTTAITCWIELLPIREDQHHDFERIGEKQHLHTESGIKIPLYRFPVSPGRKVSDMIESAVIDVKLRREGYNSAKEFMANHKRTKQDED